MNRYKILAFTLHKTKLKELESLFVEENILKTRLEEVKKSVSAEGLMYLGTCHRLELIFSHPSPEKIQDFTLKALQAFHPEWNKSKLALVASQVAEYNGEEAVNHLFQVASSLNSLVVGEREIITQVRSAYEWSHEQKLTDDYIRILIRKTIETAKKVYTQTKISDKPVSVMSLACRRLQQWNIGFDTRVLMIGAGQTADVMVKYLSKHGFTKFVIFNRTLKRAKELARRYNVEALPLSSIYKYQGGFDLLITCVKSARPVVTEKLYHALIANDIHKNNSSAAKQDKIIVDLGLPMNTEKALLDSGMVRSITMKDMKEAAANNLTERKKEIAAATSIIKSAIKEFSSDIRSRKVEIAMREVPVKIKEIKSAAITSVFQREIDALSPGSREVLEKVVDYLEKKYISLPMQMAKKILADSGN